MSTAFMILALVTFVLAAFGVQVGHVRMEPIGLAFMCVAALLAGTGDLVALFRRR